MTCAHFLEVFRSSYQIMGYMVLSLLLGARVASARVDTADLTRPELPAGWTTEKTGRYPADNSLKLDKNGSAIQTAAYPAAVTNLKITIKGNSIKGASSLDIFSSADGTTFEANAWTNITGITGSKTDYVFILPAEPGSRAFRFVYNKDKGNLGFYQVVAEYSDAAAPVAPNVLPAENVGATAFSACWEKVPGATDYLFTLERIVSAAMVVSNHFDNHPDYIEPGWEIPTQKFANTDASSGVAPNALKLEESGMIFQTPLYSSPIQRRGSIHSPSRQRCDAAGSSWISFGRSQAVL